MDRKRLITVVAICVALVFVLGVAVAVAMFWPMISGNEIVVGSPPDQEAFATAPVSRLTVPSEPVAVVAGPPDRAAGGEGAVSLRELLVGEWQTFQANEQQQEGAYFVFYEPENGAVGELWFCPDPAQAGSYEGWVAAEWELSDDGVLSISPVTVGFVSSEYEIDIRKQEQNGRVYRTMYMSTAGSEGAGVAGLVKMVPPDPDWDEFRPEPYDTATFAEATAAQEALAEEITRDHYPAFEVQTVRVEAGDPETSDEPYMGDALHVALRLPRTDAVIADTYYIAPEGAPDPVWLGPDGGADGYELGETDDGTPYIFSTDSLGVLQGDTKDPTLSLLLEYVAYYYPDSVVARVEAEGGSAFLLVTRWDAYLTQEAWFSLEWTYHSDEQWWELVSSGRTLG